MPNVIALPANVEAERAVLSYILTSPKSAPVALDSLSEDDFSDAEPRNKILFHAMKEAYAAKKNVEVQTVYATLCDLHLEESSGGMNYLLTLADSAINEGSLDAYINLVREQSILRELLLKVRDIQNEYSNGVSNVGDFILRSNDAIAKIAQKRSVAGMRQAGEVAKQVEREIERLSKIDNRGVTGIDTGYRRLNSLTHGWHEDELIILAARPAMGKTALAMNFVWNAAERSHVPVAFFSLEMSAEKIMERLVAARSSVDGQMLQLGRVNLRDKTKISSAVEEIAGQEIYLNDTPNCMLGDIIAQSTKLKANHPNLGLIVIDYIGLIRTSERAAKDRQQEVQYISQSLKNLARTLHTPVMCLAQISRAAEQGDNKVPSLSNLRESGSIEQDADVVMLLYRADYYEGIGQSVRKKKSYGHEEHEEQPQPAKKPAQSDVVDAQVMVAKNRHGATGMLNLMFQKKYSRFDEPSTEFEERQAAMMAQMDED